MVVPALTARVEQGHAVALNGINPVVVIAFVEIAPAAGKSPVLCLVSSALACRDDVIHLVRGIEKSFWGAAILAAMPCSGADKKIAWIHLPDSSARVAAR